MGASGMGQGIGRGGGGERRSCADMLRGTCER